MLVGLVVLVFLVVSRSSNKSCTQAGRQAGKQASKQADIQASNLNSRGVGSRLRVLENIICIHIYI